MTLRDIPPTSFLIGSNHEAILAHALASALPCKPYAGCYIIEGGPCSIRILANENCAGLAMTKFNKELWPLHMARELQRMTYVGEARYENAPRRGMVRGWEVYKASFGRNYVAVVYAKWL